MSNNSRCCGGVEKVVEEETGCCSGSFEVTDQSKMENPEKPKKEITNSLLKEFEAKSEKLGIINIGYSKIPVDVLDSNSALKYFNAIVLTFPIGMDIIDDIPGDEAQKLNDKLYEDFGNSTYELSDYLRKEGFETQVAHPFENLIGLSKLGQSANLGYIGKSGLLITPEIGPRLKISAILTSIENLPYSQENSHEWIRNYCERCSKCIKACLEEALIEKDNKLAKADILDDKCIGCSQGCTYCIEACPFFEKGYEWVKEKQTKLESKLKEKGKL